MVIIMAFTLTKSLQLRGLVDPIKIIAQEIIKISTPNIIHEGTKHKEEL